MNKYLFVGDVHGCFDELVLLLGSRGFNVERKDGRWSMSGGDGSRVVYLGDICDRGPKNYDTFSLVYDLWKEGVVDWVMGNHDYKLFRWMVGNEVKIGHGLDGTIRELSAKYTKEKMYEIGRELLDNLPLVMIFDDSVIAAHAYPHPKYLYKPLKKSTKALYGPEENGVRVPWWETYNEDLFAVFGHYWLDDPTPRDKWCCVDTSCCRGGKLSMLAWPEMQVLQQDALEVYCEE